MPFHRYPLIPCKTNRRNIEIKLEPKVNYICSFHHSTEVVSEFLVETETTVNISKKYSMEGPRGIAVPMFYQTNYQKIAIDLGPGLKNQIIELRNIPHLLTL